LEGNYRLHLLAPGKLSQMIPVQIERAKKQSVPVSLTPRELWSPLAVPRGYHLFEAEGRTDVLVATDHGFRRVSGPPGQTVWEVTRLADTVPAAGRKSVEQVIARFTQPALSEGDLLIPAAFDLDGDGVADLVLANTEANLLALSGADGKVL